MTVTPLHARRPIAIDLFSGAGGMTLGFEQAGFDVVASVEIDPIHSATHKFNFPQWTMICANVEDLSGASIRSMSGIESQIDLVFGGPPCQGFSMIGKRLLDDPRNSLMSHFLRLVSELHPKYFVIENVSGLTMGKHRKLLLEIIADFAKVGYDVRLPYQVLNAAEYGVPQCRRRLFLLGCQMGLPLPEYPFATCIQPSSRTVLQHDDLTCQLTPTVWDAIGDLPDIDQYEELLVSDSVHVCLGQGTPYTQRLRQLAPDPSDFSFPRKFDPMLLTSSLRTVHTELSQQRFRQTPQGKVEPISRFLRLDAAGLCNTLRAGTPSNRGAFTSPRPIHPCLPRVISVREAARLHSYPDWFRFHSTKGHGFRQVGNSVPPLLARSVGSSVIKALGISPLKLATKIELGDEQLLTMTMGEAAEFFGVDKRIIEPRKRSTDVV